MNVANIIEGTAKEILGVTNEVIQQRLDICNKCALKVHSSVGDRCNNKLWLDPDNNITSLFAKEGFYKGCGCRINAKVRCESCQCPAKKW